MKIILKKFFVMQSPLCKKLFSFTCKNVFTLWRTLNVFLIAFGSCCCLLLNIYLFYETWMPTVVPNTEISYTFWPITHKLFTPKFNGFVNGKPFSFDAINGFYCKLFLYVSTLPKPFDEPNCPDYRLVIG